jgi:divalent metal cation (Fe/Co/Zn/Cd) transporter
VGKTLEQPMDFQENKLEKSDQPIRPDNTRINIINKVQLKISAAVVGSYIFKSAIKLVCGLMLLMPPLIADGIHSFIDILEHGALVLAGRHARRSDPEIYPLDREPLIDLVSLAIFVGLVLVGFNFLAKSLKNIAVVIVKAGWISFEIPSWITEYLPASYTVNINFLWVVALILLICYVVSEIVFRFQYRLANDHGLREMQADAMELRSDGWLELAMGLGFIAGWITSLILSKTSNSTNVDNFSSLFTSLILLCLSIYLIKIAIPEIYKKYQSLMNVALEPSKRVQLEKIINDRLPERCFIWTPLTTFFRGQQIFVTGHINIDRSLMISADMIMMKARLFASRFLSDISNDVRVQFSPFFFWNKQSIMMDLKRVLQIIWSASPTSEASKAFLLLREGNIVEAQKVVLSNPPKNTPEAVLAAYVKAESSLQINGPHHPTTKQEAKTIEKLIVENPPLPMRVIIATWLLNYTVHKSQSSSEAQHAIIKARNQVENLIVGKHSEIPDIVRAEASFAIGYSWERCADYDLQKCKDYYRRAEMFYIQSGLRSEIDRLMNTWGHLETLLYSLGDAQHHLELALDIRNRREDSLGLSFTYGCLGDLYSRLGDFNMADHYYTKDIELLEILEIKNQIPLVMCKQGEARIRAGLTKVNSGQVLSGIDLCSQSEQLSKNIDRQRQFFQQKGQLKGWLGLTSLSSDNLETKTYLERCAELFEKFFGRSTYERAFVSRLTGRYYGLLGNMENARKNLNEAANYFDQMKESRNEIELSLQSIACRLEILRYEMTNNLPAYLRVNPVDELENFLKPYGGMLGEASIYIHERIDEIRKAINNESSKKNEAMTYLYQLIWFIEG